MRVWVTKYALTTGIYEIEAEDVGNGMVKEVGARYSTYFHGTDYHTTPESAASKAEVMRIAKINSLQKQLLKLEKLKF